MARALHLRRALLPSGWTSDVRLTFEHGLVSSLEPGVPALPGDDRAALGVPGLPNVHSHAFQRGMAGLAEYRGDTQDTFWTWRELMYRFLAHMSPDDVEAIAAQAYVEMLESGFTRVGEFHYLHHAPGGAPYANPHELSERIVAAAARTGIALTLLPVFYAHGGCGGAPPTAGQRRFLTDLDGYARLVEAARSLVAGLPQGRWGLAPHSLRAVTPDELREILALAPDVPIHIHASEQLREVEECVAWSGLRPVEWLLDHAAVDSRFCLVHATHLTAAEVERLARSGAVAGLCPITEANLGDGVFPTPAFRAAGGRFGIGSDSNVSIAAAGELRLIEYAQRLQLRARNLLAEPERSTGRVLFDGAVGAGGQALGAPAGIALGAPADLVTLDLELPAFAAHRGDAVLDSWIFAAAHGGVDGVWRGGEQVVVEGRHRERDAIAARYRRTLEGLARS